MMGKVNLLGNWVVFSIQQEETEKTEKKTTAFPLFPSVQGIRINPTGGNRENGEKNLLCFLCFPPVQEIAA